MDNEVIANCKEQLEQEAALLADKEEALRKQLAEVRADAKRIASFIKNLDSDGKRKQSKPSAKASDVLKVVLAVMEQVQTVSLDKLYEVVGEQLGKAGYTRMGVKLRLQEVLSDERFAIEENEVSLAKEVARVSA